MKHADLAIMFQEGAGLGRHAVNSGAYAGFHGDGSGSSWLPRPIGIVLLWLERRRQRQTLDQLDDRMLKDIGLNRVDVIHEIEKPFWQP